MITQYSLLHILAVYIMCPCSFDLWPIFFQNLVT